MIFALHPRLDGAVLLLYLFFAGSQNYLNANAQQGGYGQGQQNTYRTGRGGFYGRGGISYQRGGYRGVSVGKPQSKEKLKFESDYDFEKANEQFQETLNNISLDLKKTKLEGYSLFAHEGLLLDGHRLLLCFLQWPSSCRHFSFLGFFFYLEWSVCGHPEF